MQALWQWFESRTNWELVLYGVVGAFLVQLVFARVLLRIASRTKTEADDEIVGALRVPLFTTIMIVTAGYAWRRYRGVDPGAAWTWHDKMLLTVGLVVWTRAAMRIADAVLDVLSRRVDQYTWIDRRSFRLYAFATKLLVIGVAVYCGMSLWHIDLTAWVASAGIVGIAVGFAARETLANLFAGLFLFAEAPYKEGDFIVLGGGERGRVTRIGLRSTRLLTRDDVEITLPNIVIAADKIINEAGGPAEKRRIRVDVGVAYGSDIDQVRAVLLDVISGCDLILPEPPPSVRFREMADSALVWQVRGWVGHPIDLGRAIDQLNTAIYKRFDKEGIEIPFPQRVVHLVRDR